MNARPALYELIFASLHEHSLSTMNQLQALAAKPTNKINEVALTISRARASEFNQVYALDVN
jgi:hypothetical protein